MNYLAFLSQQDLCLTIKKQLVEDFYLNTGNKLLMHPYPASLRVINISKFYTANNIESNVIINGVAEDIQFVADNLEYHLLGNHLLENAFALYVGGLFLDDNKFLQKGKTLLVKEFQEQILCDGMHYERSPMYHLIILERLLDSLNFAQAYDDDLETILRKYAVIMTGYTLNWCGINRFPMMQDSAYGVALEVSVILDYSKRLLKSDFPSEANKMSDSGYRILNSGHFMLFANVGSIGPSYQPGHAHADELNFELFYRGVPVIVDTGVSTYEKSERRQLERATRSHNCVVLGTNSSDVWSSFRVGKRASVKIRHDDDKKIVADHDGFGSLISRTYDSTASGVITIIDESAHQASASCNYGKGYLHLHPDVDFHQKDEDTFVINNHLELKFRSVKGGPLMIKTEQYLYANGFNVLVDARVITYSMFEQVIIQIREAS
jgi:uncharacterized heparinase superfamily protein